MALERIFRIRNKAGFAPPSYTTDEIGADFFRRDDGVYAGKAFEVTDGYFISQHDVEAIHEALKYGGENDLIPFALKILGTP